MSVTPDPTPVTPISERQFGADHDRAIIGAMERIALAGEGPIDVIVDFFDPLTPIASALQQFADFGLRALAEIDRLTTEQRCCRGCPDCMGISGRNQIIGQAAEIDRQAQVIADRDATIAELRAERNQLQAQARRALTPNPQTKEK